MSFRPDAKLDPSEVENAGRGGFGGGRGVAVGGGGLGAVGLIIYLVISVLGGGGAAGGLGDLSGIAVGSNGGSSTLTECKTGADANRLESCRAVGYVNSVQAWWKAEFADSGTTYTPATTVFFEDQTSTGCGDATTDVGPFYCPADKHVYIDLAFFQELHDKFGATAGSFAQGYVLAHEYGHHVQDLLGLLSRVGRDTGPQSSSVRSELQADCFAGIWAKHAVGTGFLEPLTKANIADALNAAASVGDDRIQSETQGQVDKETWTHGSAAMRQKWFNAGFKTGTIAGCNTWSGTV
jgi:predicted metalloprotease